MAITTDQIVNALASHNLKFLKVDDTHILLAVRTEQASLQLGITLAEDGEYLDIRTVQLLTCPADHRNREAVMLALLGSNLEHKLVKFGWDPADGEISASVSLPIEDSTTLLPDQLSRMLIGLGIVIDNTFPRVKKALESAPARRPDASAGATPSGGGVNPMGLGILLLGLAALLGIVYLFTH